jgi:hypothetical protein
MEKISRDGKEVRNAEAETPSAKGFEVENENMVIETLKTW